MWRSLLLCIILMMCTQKEISMSTISSMEEYVSMLNRISRYNRIQIWNRKSIKGIIRMQFLMSSCQCHIYLIICHLIIIHIKSKTKPTITTYRCWVPGPKALLTPIQILWIRKCKICLFLINQTLKKLINWFHKSRINIKLKMNKNGTK